MLIHVKWIVYYIIGLTAILSFPVSLLLTAIEEKHQREEEENRVNVREADEGDQESQLNSQHSQDNDNNIGGRGQLQGEQGDLPRLFAERDNEPLPQRDNRQPQQRQRNELLEVLNRRFRINNEGLNAGKCQIF